MLKKFTKKPIEVVAIKFTKKMHKELVALGKNPKENPISIKIPEILEADTYWNWHLQQLYINTTQGEKEVNITDWIVKSPFDDGHIYYPVKNEIMFRTYDACGVSLGEKKIIAN